MYKEAWKDLPFADSFRKRFDVEKMRLWKIESGIRKIDGALETILNSSNPASCHKFRNSTYIFVPNDLAVVNFCMDKLSKNEQIMSELRKELLEHNNSLFNHSNALKHKCFKAFSNKQNEDYLIKLGELAPKSTSYQEELTSVANKLKLTFKGIEKNNRKKKQQSQRKNAKKSKQRKLERNLRTMKHTFSLIFPQSSFEEFKTCDAERQLQSLNVEGIAELKQLR